MASDIYSSIRFNNCTTTSNHVLNFSLKRRRTKAKVFDLWKQHGDCIPARTQCQDQQVVPAIDIPKETPWDQSVDTPCGKPTIDREEYPDYKYPSNSRKLKATSVFVRIRQKKWTHLEACQVGFQFTRRSPGSAEDEADVQKELETFRQILGDKRPGGKRRLGPRRRGADSSDVYGSEVTSFVSFATHNFKYYEPLLAQQSDVTYVHLCASVRTLTNEISSCEMDDLLQRADNYEELNTFVYCHRLQKLRRKKKWSIEKAHKQMKTKYCQTVCNNGREKSSQIFIHHRVHKLMVLQYANYYKRMRSRTDLKRIDSKEIDPKSTPRAVQVPKTVRKKPTHQVLTAYNADQALDADVVNLMLTLQDRDITPEDYEILLRLDERVKVKTAAPSAIENLRFVLLDSSHEMVNNDLCPICLDLYQVSHKVSRLPCGHHFHHSCIERWLDNSSPNCPIDGQEVT